MTSITRSLSNKTKVGALALAVASAALVAVCFAPAKAYAGTLTITLTPDAAGTAAFSTGMTGLDGGETVTMTVIPNNGYEVSTLPTILDAGGTATIPTKTATNTYTFKMPTSSVTVTIPYTKLSMNVTFDDNGGTGGIGLKIFTYGDTFKVDTLPTRDGYTFLGYYDQQTDGNLYITADGRSARSLTYSADEDSMTLYAQWEKIQEKTVVATGDNTPFVFGGVALVIAAAGLVIASRKLGRKEF